MGGAPNRRSGHSAGPRVTGLLVAATLLAGSSIVVGLATGSFALSLLVLSTGLLAVAVAGGIDFASAGTARDQGIEAARRREIARALDQHKRTEARWLEYEMDAVKLLDFPMMTDMRARLTVAFHDAKRRADRLRPDEIDDIMGDRAARLEYRDAVRAYVSAFEVAEAEAIRRRRSDFSAEAQARLARTQRLLRLATDGDAPPWVRQDAYSKVRNELDGLIVLPVRTLARLERRVAGEIET